MDPITGKIITGVSKELAPKIYEDGLQPAVQEIGKALGTVASTINVALSPLSWMIYGFERIDNQVKSSLEEKLSNTSPDKISTPEANIVVPAYEALRYSLDKKELRQLYVNLIATSMVEDTKDRAHPAFVEVIKQLSPFEATLLSRLTNTSSNAFGIVKTRIEKSQSDTSGYDWKMHIIDPCFGINLSNYTSYSVALDNLHRLKLIEIDYTSFLIDETEYTNIESGDIVTLCRNIAPTLRDGYPSFRCKRGKLDFTQFGKTFINACVK